MTEFILDSEFEQVDNVGLIRNALRKGIMDMTKGRHGNSIHASSLSKGFCPREYAILVKGDLGYNHPMDMYPGLALTFQIGHAIHEITGKALEKILRAKEVRLEVKKYKIKIMGTCDLILKLDDEYFIAEVKSISGEEFKNLTEPLLIHILQLIIYMWMAKEMKTKMNVEKGYVIYVSKAHSQSPFKVFEVSYADNQDFIKDLERKLKEVKTFSAKGTMPKRVCKNKFGLMAKNCKCANLCFEEEK
jgi:hypothetical protein